MTAFKGWKTLSFGLLVTVLPVILSFLGSVDWNNSGLPAWGISLIGIIILLLRSVTSTAIGKTGAVILAIGLASSLAACASSPRVTNNVLAAEQAMTTAQQLALIYTTLPRCPATAPCSDPATVARIKSLDQTAHDAVVAARSNEALLSLAISAIGNFKSAIPAN